MGYKRLFILVINIFSFLRVSNGCQISGDLNLGPVPNHLTIEDTFRGIIRSEATTNIGRIINISYGGALVSSQAYLTITHENSQFVVQTSSAFEQYEANEVALNFPVTINFECTGGNTSPLILMIHITDINNNRPEFIPTNAFEFVVTAPLPPGSVLTGCLNEITVKDIDLTTSSIIFEIEDNPYFEIEYDAASCPAPATKEFKAQLRTSTFIRTLEEPITLTITATDVDATGDPPLSTSGTIRITGNPQFEFPVEPVFSQTLYFATYTDNHQITQLDTISLQQGFDDTVLFSLDGEYKEYFAASQVGNQVSLVVSTPLPNDVLEKKEIYLIVRADREFTSGDSATIVIRLPEETPLLFERPHYEGSIVDNTLRLSPLVLSEGYDGVTVLAEIIGDYSTSFTAIAQGNLVTVTMVPLTDDIIENNNFIFIRIVVSTDRSVLSRNEATTIVTLEIIKDDIATPAFDKSIYTGSYDPVNGLTVEQIAFVQGFDDTVSVDLLGEHKNLFQINEVGPIISLTSLLIPPELFEEQRITLSIEASKPRTVGANAAIIITLPADSQTGSAESFDKVIFEGFINNGVVNHETIRITGFSGTSAELLGEYASLFEAVVTNGEVFVKASGTLTLPDGTTHLVLELHAGTAIAVLVLDVNQSDVPTPTVVSFGSASYAIRVKITDTGLVGQVQATADNGEAVQYSLQLDNAHLLERLSINDGGELHLSAPVNSGLYSFQAVATTIFTHVTGTATVHLSAEAITVCGDEIVMPPLIVLDRDEEEAHYDLISTYEGCHFSLLNRWPLDQTWLYVDETGLHTTAIDREHESIAFMTLSQVQVEITLHCETDETRIKRSLNSNSLVPQDYGSSKWVLTDTIDYNPRRSLVNLIVNDINDNAPVFIGKEQEPIAVGYPVDELEEIVLPRSLVELQATDADIGENAELQYWSTEPALAVAPLTGFVHIRGGTTLVPDTKLTVHATDRNGHEEGLTGSIDILVKLLDSSNIAVVTVRDAFLDDENSILSLLSASVGYQIKVLRSVVISDGDTNVEAARKKRDVSSATGASLQLYAYGLINREPVSIDQLTTDITNAVLAQVNIASTVSLEDHLAGLEICVIPGRDTGLLVATIVLSVLLFITIVLIAVWVFLRWRKAKNYEQFSDVNSLASKTESVDQFNKPMEIATKPRLNIEELKKSERRLQEMLDAPIQEITVEPSTSRKNATSLVDMPLPNDPNASIIIQSRLKDAADDSSDDEFGERKSPRRKSVVTFNENVEKIIHIEDSDAELENSLGYEIYKL